MANAVLCLAGHDRHNGAARLDALSLMSFDMQERKWRCAPGRAVALPYEQVCVGKRYSASAGRFLMLY